MINDPEFLSRTVSMERLLNAPIELVWEAWTIPEHIVRWWNPRGSETIIDKHEFKVGGGWKYSMIMPNGRPFIAEGVYTEIVHHKRIFSKADFKPMTAGVIIQSFFEPIGSKTQFTFCIVHPTDEYKIQQEKMGIQNGWGAVFDRLELILVELVKNNEL